MAEHRLPSRPTAGSLSLVPLIELVSRAAHDKDGAVLLRADDWGASYDLDELSADKDQGFPLLRRLGDLLGRLDPTRVRMRIDTRCLGPAFALACAVPVDAAPDARLGSSEIRYGIPPLLGIAGRLPARLPGELAVNVLFHGSVLTGEAWSKLDGAGDGSVPDDFRPRPIASALPPPTADVHSELLGCPAEDLAEVELKILSRTLDDSRHRCLRERLHELMARDLFSTRVSGKYAVYGNGHMGATITAALASSGIDVVMVGRDSAKLDAALEEIRRALARLSRRGPLCCDPESAFAHVTATTTSPADVSGVIEAVAEEAGIKRAVLDRARSASPDAWLATTSSSIVLDDLGGDVGLLHFAYPAETGPVVEVSYPTSLTSEALSGMRSLTSAMGKSAVEVRSVPGYVVSRILFAYLLEAVDLVEAGASPEDVDTAARRAGYMFGPLSMLDAAGIDLARHVARDVLEPEYGSRFRSPPLLDRMVETGDLGRGTGCGFFVYDSAGVEPNPALSASPAVGATPDIETRLQLSVVAESVRLANECVASPAGIDLLAVGCLRYPLGACGPLAQLRDASPATLAIWNGMSDSERLSLPPNLEETA
ncbi:MAG: hypothetical protein DYH08_11365 [Actinobacteria bacterium ATB1]|nr:hypothetical protein [Actinobacteria bacterium ATB1]